MKDEIEQAILAANKGHEQGLRGLYPALAKLLADEIKNLEEKLTEYELLLSIANDNIESQHLIIKHQDTAMKEMKSELTKENERKD